MDRLPTRRTPLVCAAVAGSMGILVLAGWATDSTGLKTLAPGLAPVAPNIALCLVALAGALAITATNRESQGWRIFATTLASLTIVIGLLTLAEFAFDWNPGLDTLFVTGVTAPENPFPGRMRPATAMALATIGLAVLLLREPESRTAAQILAALSGLAGLASLGALSMGFNIVNRVPGAGVAVQTALALLILSLGVMAATPSVGLLARAGSKIVPVGFALSLAAVGTAGIGSYVNSTALAEVEQQVGRTQRMLAQVAAIVAAAQEAESAARGYAATGDPAFLAPLHEAERALSPRIEALRRSVADDSGQMRNLTGLADFAMSRVAQSRSLADLRRAQGAVAAQRMIAEGAGRRTMDSVRAAATRLGSAESALLAERQAIADARAAATQVGALASAGLSITILLVIFAALRREVRERARAEEDVKLLNRELESRVERRTEDLYTSEHRLRVTLNSMMEGAQIVGFDWRYLYVNPVAAQHGRRPAAELVGRTMMECYPGIDASPVGLLIQSCLTRRTHHVADNEFVYPDGAKAWFRLSISPVEEGAFLLSVDITERRKSEEALRQSELRQRALFRGIPDQVFLIDSSLTVIDFHAPAESHLPIPATQIVGRRISDLLPAGAAAVVAALSGSLGAAHAPVQFEYSLAVSGGKRAFDAMAVPMGDGRITLVARDVTERRAVEGQLRQSQKMEAVGQLTGGIAHDFNNILTVIGSNAELVARSVPPESEAAQDIAELKAAVSRGATMIAQLLKFSRQGMVARRTMNVNDVFGGMTAMLRRLLPETVRLETQVEERPMMISADSGALEQIVMNLCTNARDAMPSGGLLRIACTRTVIDRGYLGMHPWVKPGAYACVEVADNGTGMDEATRTRIFEPFFTTKPPGSGTGLGMAMVYGMMKEHEGFVNVYSEPHTGSVVKLYFPLVSTPAEPQTTVAASEADTRGGDETILLVEDDAAIRRATRRALEGRGYLVLDAADGEIALEILRKNRETVALVISDLVMPNLGGRQLAEAIRADGLTIPLLIMSGYADTPTYRNAELPAGVEFLHKPWTLRDLFVKVRTLLDRQ